VNAITSKSQGRGRGATPNTSPNRPPTQASIPIAIEIELPSYQHAGLTSMSSPPVPVFHESFLCVRCRALRWQPQGTWDPKKDAWIYYTTGDPEDLLARTFPNCLLCNLVWAPASSGVQMPSWQCGMLFDAHKSAFNTLCLGDYYFQLVRITCMSKPNCAE